MAVPELDMLMRSQYGLISRKQALQVISKKQLEWLLVTNKLNPVYRGLYRTSGAPFTSKAAIFGATLACRSRAVASHTSALHLFGLPTFGIASPHVTITKGSTKIGGIHVHRSPVDSHDLTFIDRIPSVKASRACIDVAGELSKSQLTKVLNKAVIRGLCTYQDIQASLERAGSQGRRGAETFRIILSQHLALPATRSPLVMRLMEAVAAARLPMPVLEHRVVINNRTYFLDAAWPGLRLAVEMDDFGSHGKSRKRFDNDRRRNNDLLSETWRVIHLTAAMSNREFRSAIVPFFG